MTKEQRVMIALGIVPEGTVHSFPGGVYKYTQGKWVFVKWEGEPCFDMYNRSLTKQFFDSVHREENPCVNSLKKTEQ